MIKEDLLDRTKKFSIRVVRLVAALPNSNLGRRIGDQLLRSETSVGANYRAACRGRSRAEFIAKLGIVEEEADESAYWMELIAKVGLLRSSRVEPLRAEAVELRNIMAKSRITAGKSLRGAPIRQSAIGSRQ
jgi:four helix bundle protein